MGQGMPIVTFHMDLIYSLVTINVCVVRHRSFVKPVHIRMLEMFDIYDRFIRSWAGRGFWLCQSIFSLGPGGRVSISSIECFQMKYFMMERTYWREVGGGHMPAVK